MESSSSCLSSVHAVSDGSGENEKGREQSSQVDSFLVEALENPRHRLTVLRMELEIQAFMRSVDKQQFEFQHFPTSYLRCAAHRVAQHYGLQTMVLDTSLDGSGRIVVRKTSESRFPGICLSDIPAKQPAENDNSEHKKIVIRPRPNKGFQSDADRMGVKRSSVRTVEERKEEYDRARARIFNGSSSSDLQGPSLQAVADGRSFLDRDVVECHKNSFGDFEKVNLKDGSPRVAAIFRDREKDRTDPDYDRSYDRYIRSSIPNQSLSLDQYNMLQPPFMQYETGLPQIGQVSRVQTSLNFRLPNPIMNAYSTNSCNQTSRDVVYMQWPSPAMMYAHSYGHFRHASFQVPFYQQPLSFESSKKL